MYNYTGINFSKSFSNLQAYPNPASNFLQIENTDALNIQSIELK